MAFLEILYYMLFFAVAAFNIFYGEKLIDKFSVYLDKILPMKEPSKSDLIECIEKVLAVCMMLIVVVIFIGFHEVGEKLF